MTPETQNIEIFLRKNYLKSKCSMIIERVFKYIFNKNLKP